MDTWAVYNRTKSFEINSVVWMFDIVFEPHYSIIADYQGRVHGLLQRDQRQHRPRLILRPHGADRLETVTGIGEE